MIILKKRTPTFKCKYCKSKILYEASDIKKEDIPPIMGRDSEYVTCPVCGVKKNIYR